MSNSYLIVLGVLVVAGIVLLLYRSNRKNGTTRSQDERQARSRLGLDHATDREESRLAHMSAEDRDWEQASLQRNLEIQERRIASAE